MQMKKALFLGIVLLATVITTGCADQPTGLYEDEFGGVHALKTTMVGPKTLIKGELQTTQWCNYVMYTIAGEKPADGTPDDVVYIATKTEPDVGNCWDAICMFVHDSSEAGDWSLMEGEHCDCSNYPEVGVCQGVGLTYIGPLPPQE